MKLKKKLSIQDSELLLDTLKSRFEKNATRNKSIQWDKIASKLTASPEKLWSLSEMERTGGEPDVIGQDENTGEYVFCDCATESPQGRRSICFDQQALDARKANKPTSNAMTMAAEMGIELTTEAEYRALQELGKFDLKTSSWIATPPEIRKLGGALFCDRRYDKVFTYHNGADSYYGVRGFRGILRV